MASPVPAKSQPLHNFSLPHLKWKNHRTNRSRLAGESSSSQSPPHRSPSTPSYVPRRPSPLHRQSQSESESEHPVEKTLTTTEKTKRSNNNNSNNKICIRIRKNDVVPEVNQNDAVQSLATEEDDESLPKTWNLRPRRPPPMNQKQSNNNNNNKIGSLPLPENKITYNKNCNKEGSEMKNNDQSNAVISKKVKFSIALSRDEIEEDIYSLTGSKPVRRPKKRPRTLQRQLDTLFPGLWLGLITADTYKVSEAPTKV